MKLTQEQIAVIDENLVLNKVVYDDIKLELTDHIASEIEEKMMANDISFEVALEEGFEKWDEQLSLKSNLFWAPFWLEGPKVLMDKWIKESKKQFLFCLLLSVLITFITAKVIMQYKSKMVLNILDQGYEILMVLTILLLSIGRYIVYKSKIKTAYSFMFNVHCIGCIIIFTLQLLRLEFDYNSIFMMDQKFEMRRLFSTLFMNVLYFNYGVYTFYFLQKHFEFIRKLAKI